MAQGLPSWFRSPFECLPDCGRALLSHSIFFSFFWAFPIAKWEKKKSAFLYPRKGSIFIFRPFQDFWQSCTGPSDRHLKSKKGSKDRPCPILTWAPHCCTLLVTINLCEKTLIDHQITSQDHPKADRWVGQMNGANGETRIAKVWPSKRPHWHLFHHIFCYLVKIPSYLPPFDTMLWLWLISMILQCGFKHVSSGLLCSNVWCLWLWIIWQFLNIEILFDMPWFMKEVIDLKFIGSS
jgi:hypothetical protein